MGVVLKYINGKYELVEGEAKVQQPILALPSKPFYPRPNARGRKRGPRIPRGNAVCSTYAPDNIVLDIIDLSAQHFGITVETLMSRNKSKRICDIRNMIYRLLYEEYGVTYRRIGAFFEKDPKGVGVNLFRLKKRIRPYEENVYQFYLRHVKAGVDMIQTPMKFTVDA